MKWYPRDWRGDGALRMCSFAARGLWADLLSLMHDEGEPYGHLTINRAVPSAAQLARILGSSAREIEALLAELTGAGVCDVADTGAIICRRMVRDKAKAEADRINGKGGGNPKLLAEDKAGVNPPDKAQKPEARGQKQEREDLKPMAPNLRASRACQTSTPEGKRARWRQKVTEFAKGSLAPGDFVIWLAAVADGDHEALERMNDAMRLAESNAVLKGDHPTFMKRGAVA